MSYRLEKKDIVLSGMENGIADSPYNGIADMRNINIIGIPGEGSVQYKEIPATQPPVMTDIPFTASASTDRLTYPGPDVGLYEGCAISLNFTNSVDVLVVAGGGGGGGGGVHPNVHAGGGGGAGGFQIDTLSFPVGTYAVTVGAGGTGGAAGTAGVSGDDSSIAALVVSTGGGGGGKGASSDADGSNGGSGGGGGALTGIGGTGVVGQGEDGGNGAGPGAVQIGGGGGGGASVAGSVGSGLTGGNGGDGTSSSISGSAVDYAGGGGGGAWPNSSGIAGTGGVGGGGGGGGFGTSATIGTANLGGGGGGGKAPDGLGGDGEPGAAGGSGIVIISYVTGTVNATGGTITTSGGRTIHTFTTSGDFVVTTGGLTAGTIYYVRNIVGLTFQLSLSVIGNIIDISADSVGTFTVYTYGNMRGLGSSSQVPPIAYVVDRNAENGLSNGVYMTDLSNYVWGIFPIELPLSNVPANHLVFLGNIGGIGADAIIINGLTIWKGYILLFGLAGGGPVDIASLYEIFIGDGPTVAWDYDWITNAEVTSTNSKIATLVGQDDTVYYTSIYGVGSILEVAGETFDPTDSNTYTQTASALALPSFDRATCLAELGVNLLVGGVNSYVYPWDRVSTSFTYPLLVPENFIANIVGTNQNAYIFAGNRGRIFITNGSAIDEYKKLPDYITGILNPYYRWRDASFARNQLYFSFTVSQNDDTVVSTVNGAWAIDLKKDALYMVNKISNTGYSGNTSMVVEMPSASVVDQPAGTSLLLGWRVSNTYGIDVGSSLPYTGGESFIDFDIIPIGTFFNSFTPSQFEWKVSQPLGGNGTPETIALYYRTNLTEAFTLLGTTTLSGPTDATVALSDSYQTNFEKVQWLQVRLVSTSNDTTPTFCRFYEVRIREFKQ